MLHGILFWLFVLSIAVQCGYALYFFTRLFTLPRLKGKGKKELQKVSVIICAKNEAENLVRYLPAVLSQDFTDAQGMPLYEVLVVNDASDDATENVLQQLQMRYPHLRYIHIDPKEPRTFKGKKFALSKALETVSHELLLLTDADCEPASEAWLSLMTEPLLEGKEIVCGYGAYRQTKGFLNTFIRWETVHTFLQYASYAAAGLPYMAVGRNLACTKQTLIKAQQSDAWNALPSGDDDLLVQACGTKENIAVVTQARAFTYSDPKKNRNDWIHQKQRHLSTGKYYKPFNKLLLGGYAISHALAWLLFFVLIFFSDWSLIFTVFMMRCSIYWIIWKAAATRLKEKKLLRWMPLCDLSWGLYNFVLSPFIIFKNKQQWK